MLDLKYKSAIVYSNPRSASTFFIAKLSKILNMKNHFEIMGMTRTLQEFHNYLKDNNSVCKIHGWHYYYHHKIFKAYELNKNKSIIIIKPRDILTSYSSYILPQYMTRQRAKQGLDYGKYWNVGKSSPEDLRNLYNNIIIPYDDAILLVDSFTLTTKNTFENLDYFMSASDDVHIVTQEDINNWKENDHKTVIWDSIDQKTKHIENWDKVQEHIIKTGEKLWEKIELKI